MNRQTPNLDPEDPLAIAKKLEEIVHQGQLAGEKPDSLNSIPDDFQLAHLGLDLIIRAARDDRSRGLTESRRTCEPGISERESERDTDHWGRMLADTWRNAQSSADAPGAEPPVVASEGLLPKRVGRFEILRELGRGGFGIVLLGRDPELDRLVAVKIPRLEILVDEESRRRFDREACLVSTLSHPAIVPVYEYSTGPGVPYIAFAFCRGKSLGDWISQEGRNVTPRLAARIVSQLAGTIQYAHQRGVIHRDLKPGNILFDRETKAREEPIFEENEDELIAALRITDFGLARSLQPDTQRLTRDGAMVGTPSYMAPEQFSGRGDGTTSADIYALGAILYELLTGDPPLRRETEMATMRAVESEEPVSPGKKRNDVSRDLEAVVLKCLEKSPADRYPSAFALQQDLENVIADRPVVARRVSRAERAVRWCRRRPAVAALSATTLFAVLAAMTAAIAGWYSTSQALKREQAARAEADQAYRDSKSAIDQYFVTVSENQLLSAPGLKTLRQELLKNAVAFYSSFIERNRNDDSLAWELVKAFHYRATVDEELGDLIAARDGFETARIMLDGLRADNSGDNKLTQQYGMTLRKLARFDQRDNDFPSALQKIDAAIALHRELLQSGYEPAANHGELGLLLRDQANVLISTGNPAAANELHGESETNFLKAFLLDPENARWSHLAATSRGSQAIIAQQLGEPERALQLLLETATRLKELVGRYPDQLTWQMDLGKALANLSLAQSGMNRMEEAFESLGEATRVFDRLALIHPQVVLYQALRCSTRRNAALILTRLDRWPECESLALETLETLKSIQGEAAGHPGVRQEVALTHSLLGRVFQTAGKPELARYHLLVAVQELEQDYARNPGNLVSSQNLAESLQQLALVEEDPSTAINHLDRGRSIIRALLESRPNNTELSVMLQVNEQTRQKLFEANPDD